MNRKQKIILFSGIGVAVALIIVLVILIIRDTTGGSEEIVEDTLITDSLTGDEVKDSLQNEIYQLELTGEFRDLEAQVDQYEAQQKYIKNDTLVRQYNEAKQRVESLIKELKTEKRSNSENREKIKQLQAEISTLKDIVKHYLEEIRRLGEENSALKAEIEQVNARNEQLSTQVTAATASNERLTQTVAIAKKLNIIGLSLQGYNGKGKAEKKLKKVQKLGVSFTVAPNNTAAPGNKTFYVRIISPEGTLVGGGPSFTIDGASVQSSASKVAEYDNSELRLTIYVGANTTLTPGSYIVEVFCDGNRLGKTSTELRN